MRLTVTTFLTLDGVMQAPGGPEEDRSGGFEHGGWSFPYADEDFGRLVTGWFAQADAFLLGRRTYEIFAAFWPLVTDEADPIASPLNALPKYVASRTLESVDWQGAELLRGRRRRRRSPGSRHRPGRELQVHGSGELLQTLMATRPRRRVPAVRLSGRGRQRPPAVPGGRAAEVAGARRVDDDQHRRRRRDLRRVAARS